METVTLGMTDLKVSRIAFGAWELGGEWGSFDENAAIATIRHARERGITLFDTAQAYGFGASERILGRALRDDLDHRRDEVVIATKGGLRMTGSGLVRDSSRAGCDRVSTRACGRSASTTSICTRCTGPTRTLPGPRPPAPSKSSSTRARSDT